jgi:hypothetical protein
MTLGQKIKQTCDVVAKLAGRISLNDCLLNPAAAQWIENGRRIMPA